MAGEGAKQPVTVTRDHLYQQVWDKPMSRLAADYGISGNGLAKICDRLRIPYPPRGYWAKKAAGHKVVQYRLPEPGADIPDEVTISPTPPPAPPPQLAKEDDRQTQRRARAHQGYCCAGAPVVTTARHYCRLDCRTATPARRRAA